MSVCEQTNVSYIDVSPNLSRESFDFEPVQTGGQGPLATSSPRPNEANYGNYNTQFLQFEIFKNEFFKSWKNKVFIIIIFIYSFW